MRLETSEIELADRYNRLVKECWVNVYENGFGFTYPTKDQAILNIAFTRGKLLYRIHVRLK